MGAKKKKGYPGRYRRADDPSWATGEAAGSRSNYENSILTAYERYILAQFKFAD